MKATLCAILYARIRDDGAFEVRLPDQALAGDEALVSRTDALKHAAKIKRDFEVENRLLRHMLITCRVAATNPQAASKGAYVEDWNSGPAEQVRKLRAEYDRMKFQLDRIARFGADTLSGPSQGTDDRDWYRDAVKGMAAMAGELIE